MPDSASYPIPEGVTSSFSFPQAGANTATFTLPGSAQAVITFQPLDMNNPGVLTLYDSGNVAIFTMLAAGYAPLIVPGAGASYYISTTLGAKLVAATVPNSLR